jgi:PPOX class probable F420-dependent enzyme
MPLDEDVARLAKGKNLATVVTLMPNGQPQALLTWVDADDEHVLVNTEPQRQRARNVARDPRITVLIHSEDPQDWAEVRGHVAETADGDDARRHIDELSRKYTGHDFTAPVGPHGRVILKVTPDKVNTPRLLERKELQRPRLLAAGVMETPQPLRHLGGLARPRRLSAGSAAP